jgi:hypothetical protein
MNKTSLGSNPFGPAQVLGGSILLILLLGSLTGCAGNQANKNILTQAFSEPLGGASASKVDIHTRSGDLIIGSLDGHEDALASGSVQYLKNQAQPARSVSMSDGLTAFTLRSDTIGKLRMPLPWRKPKGALEWKINFNPGVALDLKLYSGEGAIKADLTGMVITDISAESGGGAVDITLPDNSANLSVLAKTGGGKVVVHLPSGMAARITATTGWGKVLVDPTFVKLDAKTYQSADYESAANKVEITLDSGSGDVTVDIR